MMRTGDKFGEWFIFHEDLHDELEAHFAAGGTVEMLNGTAGPSHSALYHCCNEYALDCLPIMMKHGAKPDECVWQLAFHVRRDEWIESFISHGFWPSYQIVAAAPADTAWELYCRRIVTRPLCRRAVCAMLHVARRARPPWRDLWRIVARVLWATRCDSAWLACLPE
jgi:hypothetical protein